MARRKLIEDFVRILGEHIRIDDEASGWPLLCRLVVANETVSAALYLGRVGPSGRPKRPNERRIQNPSSGTPIEDHPGRLSMLLGLDDTADEPVFVAWEVHPRIGRTTRFSVFLSLEDLAKARDGGTAVRVASNGEEILAFTKENLDWAVQTRLKEQTMEDDELDLEGLGVALSLLSCDEQPTSFPNQIIAFDADEIDWKTNGWLARVSQIEPWLHLDSPVNLQNGPKGAIEALFVGLSVESYEDTYSEAKDGIYKLRPLGFTQLERRVALAVERKEEFEKWLNEGSSRDQATKKWLALWEDEPDPSELKIVQVHAEVDVWKVKDFKDQAEAETLELNPSYQRDIVWSNSDSQKLLDSVLRGIPLPSIILNKRQGSQVYEIVDGKQRLTAILRFIGHHPDGVSYAMEKSTEDAPFELFRTDYRKWRRKLGIKSPEERQHCLPFKLSSYSADDPLHELGAKYYHEISTKEVTIQGKSLPVKTMFESPSKVYLLPVIVYEDTDIHQIHRVFGLYNKQGKQLNAEELRNAIYHQLDLTKLLLVLAGDNDRPDELVPFIQDLTFEPIPTLFHELQVGESRFHRTKLVSWVTAVLLQPPKRNDGVVSTPSTSGFINQLLDSVTDDHRHILRDHDRLQILASALVRGALLFSELRAEEEAFAPSFPHKKSEGARWEDLPTVAALTACTLAIVSGIEISDAEDMAEAVLEVTATRRPLEKQQSRTQWGYLVRTVLELLTAMGVDTSDLSEKLHSAFGFNCLAVLRDVDDLGISLE